MNAPGIKDYQDKTPSLLYADHIVPRSRLSGPHLLTQINRIPDITTSIKSFSSPPTALTSSYSSFSISRQICKRRLRHAK